MKLLTLIFGITSLVANPIASYGGSSNVSLVRRDTNHCPDGTFETAATDMKGDIVFFCKEYDGAGSGVLRDVTVGVITELVSSLAKTLMNRAWKGISGSNVPILSMKSTKKSVNGLLPDSPRSEVFNLEGIFEGFAEQTKASLVKRAMQSGNSSFTILGNYVNEQGGLVIAGVSFDPKRSNIVQSDAFEKRSPLPYDPGFNYYFVNSWIEWEDGVERRQDEYEMMIGHFVQRAKDSQSDGGCYQANMEHRTGWTRLSAYFRVSQTPFSIVTGVQCFGDYIFV